MLTNMYPHIHAQDWSGHAISWALDREDSGEAKPVRLNLLPDPANPGTHEPLNEDLWVWLGAEAGAPMAAEKLADCLSSAELDRAARFRFQQDRWSYMAAHAGLRLLLGRLLDETPRDIRFDTMPGGKPALCPRRYTASRAATLQFSISHSRGLVAVALSGSPVGIDVERVRPLPDMERLIARFMAPEALSAFRATQDPQGRIALFYRNWTLGEALVKARGEGIDQGFGSFAFTQTGAPRLTRIPPGWGAVERWHLGHHGSGIEKRAAAA